MSWSLTKFWIKSSSLSFSQWLRATYLALCRLPSLTLLMVGLFTVAYFTATCFLASRKPFWFDELTTYYIARLPTLGDVWSAWSEGPDSLPPFVHLATHFMGSALGFSHVTVRLPSIVGFWLMCLCIFLFLRRRVCPMLASVGMLLPLTAPLGYSYAYEARGYGMVLGFCGAAVVCWDLAHDIRWRRCALLGLPIFLAAAIASHLYAVLVTVPLALGELVKTRERRRVDWLVWMGFVATGLVFLPLSPVLSHIHGLPELARYSSYKVGFSLLMEIWPQFLSSSTTYLGLLAFICLCHDKGLAASDAPLLTTHEGRLQRKEWALVIGLMTLPVIGWLFANLVTGLLLFRYVIATVIGFSLGIPLLCQAALKRRPEVALLLAGWVAVTAVGNIMSCKRAMFKTTDIAAGRGCFRLLQLGGKLPPDGLPIAVSDFYVFMQLDYYAPEPLKQRLVYLPDPDGLLVKVGMHFFVRVFGQHMEPLEQFLQSNRSFYVYDCAEQWRGQGLCAAPPQSSALYLFDCGEQWRGPLMVRLIVEGASLRDSGLLETHDINLRRDLYRVSLASNSTQHDIR